MSNKITSNNYVFTGDDISEANCFIGNSLAGDELAVDTLEAILVLGPAEFVTSDGDEFLTRDGRPLWCANPAPGYKYGDRVMLEHDDQLLGKFYFEKATRKSKVAYEFFCMSAVGLLGNITHYGGIYTQVAAGEIIADIMGDTIYTIADGVADVTLDGWLPVASRRANLQQVLFAVGAGIFKDTSGDIIIRYVEAATPVNISDLRIFMDGSIDYKKPCTKVDMTEHAYFALAADKLVTLFDSTSYVIDQPVLFDKPCHDLVATGLTIVASGVNYAIVTGAGSLTGKEYTHTQNIITYSPDAVGAPNVVSVTDATLVSTFNSWNVAKRVAQYFSAVSVNAIGLVVGSERPATEVSFTDTFGDLVSGYIKSMAINLSTTLKADTDIAVGFLPVGHGNNYSQYVVLTGSGTFTIPEGAERIYVIAVGGGQGGAGGYIGGWGTTGGPGSTPGGVGGAAGAGGTGGLVFALSLNVAEGSSYAYSCGTGGPGGAIQATGQAGTPTTFDSYSTSAGRSYPVGYSEPKTGNILAANGGPGQAGEHGSYGSETGITLTYAGVTYTQGTNGGTAFGNHSYAFGGGGGGPAVGNNGNNAAPAYVYNGTEYPSLVGEAQPTGGAEGATAVAPAAASDYGAGGNGGHGGGGGGAGGYSHDTTDNTNFGAPGGAYGAGSSGGKGGDGCVIIYY